MRLAYLDANANEPLRPEARAAMVGVTGLGNPASIHRAGRAARALLETARETIAARVGGTASATVFTSGGTESNALAVHALGAGRRIIVGATEHDAVRAAAPAASTLPVDHDGIADLDALDRLLAAPGRGPTLVCLMLANNETGVLHPIAEAAAICRRRDARLHVDAVQAVGRISVDLSALGADSLAISSHKLGGPAGAGALLFRPDAARRIIPLIAGGGQERGWRGGTPPLPAIAGFAAAIGCPAPDPAILRDAAERAATAVGAIVIGGAPARLPNTTCLALPGIAAMTQVIALDLAGIAVSAGAACSSGKVARSHVLDAMGLGELAGQAIRVSLPWNVTADDITAFAAAYRAMTARLFARVSPPQVWAE